MGTQSLYGSEVWAPFMNLVWKQWDTTQIEKIHTKFLKRLLGVNRSTTNVLIQSEVGRHSLQEQILARNINYIKYIENKYPPSLVKQFFNLFIFLIYSLFKVGQIKRLKKKKNLTKILPKFVKIAEAGFRPSRFFLNNFLTCGS